MFPHVDSDGSPKGTRILDKHADHAVIASHVDFLAALRYGTTTYYRLEFVDKQSNRWQLIADSGGNVLYYSVERLGGASDRPGGVHRTWPGVDFPVLNIPRNLG